MTIQSGLIKFDDIKLTDALFEFAADLGKQRSNNSKSFYQSGGEKDRGNDEGRISQLGILGEVIARKLLDSIGIKYDATPLVDKKPVNKPDLSTGGFLGTVDVKTSQNLKEYQVNYEDHNDYSHRPEYYLFIGINKRKMLAIVHAIPSINIDNMNWEVAEFQRESGTSRYYKIKKESYESCLVDF